MADNWDIDVQLLARWREGERSVGRQLYARHADAVIRYFRNKSGDIDDLVQETFTRVFDRLERIRNPRALRSFVFETARNVLREHLRNASGRNFDPAVDSLASFAPGPSTITARRREHRLILDGLRRLSLDDQILLELFYFEQIRATDLAEDYGISASAMRTRLQTARKRLEREIAVLEQDRSLVASTVGRLEDWANEIQGQLRGDPDSGIGDEDG